MIALLLQPTVAISNLWFPRLCDEDKEQGFLRIPFQRKDAPEPRPLIGHRAVLTAAS